jgi:hypothetical protein
MNVGMAILGFVLGLIGTYAGFHLSERSQKRSLAKLLQASMFSDIDGLEGVSDNLKNSILSKRIPSYEPLLYSPSPEPAFGNEIGFLDFRVVEAVEDYRQKLRLANEGRTLFLESLSKSTNEVERCLSALTYYVQVEALIESEKNILFTMHPAMGAPTDLEHRVKEVASFVESQGWMRVEIGQEELPDAELRRLKDSLEQH